MDTPKLDSLPHGTLTPQPKPRHHSLTPRDDNALRFKSKPESQDTIPPYCYADPAGGLFYDSVRVTIVADEPCSVYYKTREMPGYSVWREPVLIRANEQVFFYAMDSVGNVSIPKSETYDLEPGGPTRCPQDMANIPSHEGSFCIDRYEWPNRKGALPLAMTSHYAAQELCASVGKRLCSAQQWQLACIGKRTAEFSYGEAYEPRACNTNSANPAASGSFAECRSYYGPMDMNGNLREWTSSKSNENPRFYDVRGGYWASHSQSGCEESQYSFYPQNQHLSVGFRCCK